MSIAAIFGIMVTDDKAFIFADPTELKVGDNIVYSKDNIQIFIGAANKIDEDSVTVENDVIPKEDIAGIVVKELPSYQIEGLLND